MANRTPMQPTTSDAVARRMIDRASAEARSLGVPVTIVVVDGSGVLKAMQRMDSAPLVSVQTAINKAYAAAAIGMPPDDFYAAIESDAAAVAEFATRPGLALIAGGLPVVVDSRVAGFVVFAGSAEALEGDAGLAPVLGGKGTDRVQAPGRRAGHAVEGDAFVLAVGVADFWHVVRAVVNGVDGDLEA